MRLLFFGTLGLLALFGCDAAGASDLPTKAPPKAMPIATDPWNGFYFGINGGGALSQNHTYDITTLVPTAPFTIFDIADFKHAEAGGIFGLQGGWNWHFAPSWVAGV